MIIYIDDEHKCHTSNENGTFRKFDISFFDDKCDEFIEGYRYCPEGESYINQYGRVYDGECIVPWKPYIELENAQREYEKQRLLEYKNMQLELNTSYQEGINSI